MGLYDFQDRGEFCWAGPLAFALSASLDAVNRANPQSWNRYTYVLNNPLRLIDPLGDDCYDTGWETDASCSGPNDGGGGSSGGGGGTVSLGPFDQDSGTIAEQAYAAWVNAMYSWEVWGGPNTPAPTWSLDCVALPEGGCSNAMPGVAAAAGSGGSGGNGGNSNSLPLGNVILNLLNPNCGAMYGGSANAIRTLGMTQYIQYDQIPPIGPDAQARAAFTSNPLAVAFTTAYYTVPAGSNSGPPATTVFSSVTYLRNSFYALPESMQVTILEHELLHSVGYNSEIDQNYDHNYQQIQQNCTPVQMPEAPAEVTSP